MINFIINDVHLQNGMVICYITSFFIVYNINHKSNSLISDNIDLPILPKCASVCNTLCTKITMPTILWIEIDWSSGRYGPMGVLRINVNVWRNIKTTMNEQLKLRHIPQQRAIMTHLWNMEYDNLNVNEKNIKYKCLYQITFVTIKKPRQFVILTVTRFH